MMDKLPLDILVHILASIPNLYSLHATVLTGPAFLDAFASNRTAIVHSTLEHELGPAMCYARAVYYASTYSLSHPTDDCFKAPQLYFKNPIHGKEARTLSHYGCTIRRLAAYFTTLYKDRDAVDHRLTDRELFNFQRALLQYWALACFTTRRGWANLPDGDKLGFIYSLPTEEVAQIGDVHVFLYRLARWRSNAVYTLGEGLEYFPDVILQRLEDEVHSPMRLPVSEHLGAKLNEVYRERGLFFDNIWMRSRTPMGMKILVDGRVHSVECPRCTASPVLLWGESNLHLFRCFTSIHYLLHGMPGRLGFSMQLYEEFDKLRDVPHYMPIMYREILDIKLHDGLDWSSDLYLCEVCLMNCLKKNVYCWYARRRLEAQDIAGTPPQRNCSAGWDCNLLYLRTQEHDVKFNHFCPPKRYNEAAHSAERLQ